MAIVLEAVVHKKFLNSLFKYREDFASVYGALRLCECNALFYNYSKGIIRIEKHVGF